mgnify:FL=1
MSCIKKPLNSLNDFFTSELILFVYIIFMPDKGGFCDIFSKTLKPLIFIWIYFKSRAQKSRRPAFREVFSGEAFLRGKKAARPVNFCSHI